MASYRTQSPIRRGHLSAAQLLRAFHYQRQVETREKFERPNITTAKTLKAALINRGTAIVISGVNRRTAWEEGMGLRRTAIIGQRPHQRVGVDLIATLR
jgi:hypothetical protein